MLTGHAVQLGAVPTAPAGHEQPDAPVAPLVEVLAAQVMHAVLLIVSLYVLTGHAEHTVVPLAADAVVLNPNPIAHKQPATDVVPAAAVVCPAAQLLQAPPLPATALYVPNGHWLHDVGHVPEKPAAQTQLDWAVRLLVVPLAVTQDKHCNELVSNAYVSTGQAVQLGQLP